jgi:hypothetical protein
MEQSFSIQIIKERNMLSVKELTEFLSDINSLYECVVLATQEKYMDYNFNNFPYFFTKKKKVTGRTAVENMQNYSKQSNYNHYFDKCCYDTFSRSYQIFN